MQDEVITPSNGRHAARIPHGNATLKILPHILAAIFGVFAVAIVILWLSIGIWSRPDPDQLAPGAAQQQAPAEPTHRL